MEKVEQAFNSFKDKRSTFQEYCDKTLPITEADTGINLVDGILNDVVF
jgi:hypothetical protein